MKYKTQYDEAVSVNLTLNKNLDDMTKKVEQMKKMHDDDAICYHDALANLKSVGEEISEVLKMFPEEDVPVVDSTQTIEEHQPQLTEQVQSISSKMVKYICSSIHVGVVWTIATIKSWYP